MNPYDPTTPRKLRWKFRGKRKSYYVNGAWTEQEARQEIVKRIRRFGRKQNAWPTMEWANKLEQYD